MSQLNVRISQKYDTYENWMKSDLVLNKGEIAIAEIPTGADFTQDPGGRLTPPAIGVKIGDGAKTFKQLNWIQATAGDVYAWAKKATLDFADLDEAFKTELGQYIGDMSDTDTNTVYQFSLEGDILTINHKEKTDSAFSKLIDIDLGLSKKMDKVEGATEGNLAKFDANGQVVDAGEKISDFLKKSEAETTYAAIATEQAVSDVKVNVDKLMGDYKDAQGVATKSVAEIVAELQTDLDAKVTALIGADVPAEGETQKSIRTIANEELAAQLLSGKADADFKTLQALAAWLEDHPEEASDFNTRILALEQWHTAHNEELLKAVTDTNTLISDENTEGSVAKQIKDAKQALIDNEIKEAKDLADDANEKVDTLIGTAKKENSEELLDAGKSVRTIAEEVVAPVEEQLSQLGQDAIKEIDGVEGTKEGNKFTVTGVGVNLLHNVEGDTLVLNCGTASTVI